jgi:hypothetical protein
VRRRLAAGEPGNRGLRDDIMAIERRIADLRPA